MAQLSEKAISEFQELVRKKRGIVLTDDEAQTLALKWLKFFSLVYEPMKDKDKNENHNLRKMD